jgi:shikimate dehydrogenase
MYPNVDKAPAIPFDLIKLEHYVYDLVYNPEVTKLMSEASKRGARTKNGMEMLHLQADRSWEIWNSFV